MSLTTVKTIPGQIQLFYDLADGGLDKIIDKVNHNLLDERIIKQVEADIDSGVYNGSLVSPMCGSFSGVRAVGNDSYAPRPLRGGGGWS